MKSHFKCLFLLSAILNLLQGTYKVLGDPKIDCYFVFGDSLSDTGNNNNLPTTAKVNYRPYGMDFPSPYPTGRFSNGRNLVDFMVEYLEFEKDIPPFNNRRGGSIIHGVNYASGGAGIRRETGKTLGKVISMDEQLENHKSIISEMKELLKNNNTKTMAYLKNCLYMVEVGSNDYLNNYYLPLSYKTSRQFTPQQYANVLAQEFSKQLKRLYDEGGRKMAVFGVGAIGCTPYARTNFDTKGAPCVNELNNAVQLFNTNLKSLVQKHNLKFKDANHIFIDVLYISTNPPISNQGQIISDAPCCETGTDNVLCVPYGNVCPNRTEYTFWDGVHPTDAGYEVLANRSYNAQYPGDTYPYDISHLVQI